MCVCVWQRELWRKWAADITPWSTTENRLLIHTWRFYFRSLLYSQLWIWFRVTQRSDGQPPSLTRLERCMVRFCRAVGASADHASLPVESIALVPSPVMPSPSAPFGAHASARHVAGGCTSAGRVSSGGASARGAPTGRASAGRTFARHVAPPPFAPFPAAPPRVASPRVVPPAAVPPAAGLSIPRSRAGGGPCRVRAYAPVAERGTAAARWHRKIFQCTLFERGAATRAAPSPLPVVRVGSVRPRSTRRASDKRCLSVICRCLCHLCSCPITKLVKEVK